MIIDAKNDCVHLAIERPGSLAVLALALVSAAACEDRPVPPPLAETATLDTQA